MNKFKQLKEALKNPPIERLAKIEYQSHFWNILGITLVSIILIFKGFWYIIFAFIFSVGVSYSQGMAAYKKYVMLKNAIQTDSISIENEISPTRKRGRIIEKYLNGSWVKFLSSLISVILASLIINPLKANWWQNIVLLLLILVFWVITYYFGFYYLAKRRENAKQ